MILTDKERDKIAKIYFSKIIDFEQLSEHTKDLMIRSFKLGMMQQSLLEQEESILDTELKINKLKN